MMQRGNGSSRSLVLDITSYRRDLDESFPAKQYNLEQAIFSEGDDSEYTTRIAKTVKGARALLAVGFEYVTDMDGYKIFRKRK